jgi:hypothetical protein
MNPVISRIKPIDDKKNIILFGSIPKNIVSLGLIPNMVDMKMSKIGIEMMENILETGNFSSSSLLLVGGRLCKNHKRIPKDTKRITTVMYGSIPASAMIVHK